MNNNFKDIIYRKDQLINSKDKFWIEALEWIITLILPIVIVLLVALYKWELNDTWKTFFESSNPVFIGFSWIVVKFLMNLIRHYEFVNEKNHKLIEERLDRQLDKAHLVFETGIQKFDDNHLLALQRLLNNLPTKVKTIYAIDNSDPVQWWSETMTGYLALFSNWKSIDPYRAVNRIFVFKKGQLENKLVGKLLSLHSYHGMKTYVFSKDKFDKLFEDYTKEGNNLNKNFNKKELLIWEKPDDSSYSSFSINNHTYSNTIFYESFWNIDWDIDERQTKEEYLNYYGSPIKRDTIKIWFEFVTLNQNKESLQLSENYMQFIKFLISKTCCCFKGKDVKSSNGEGFGIEIKTELCKNCQRKCEEEKTDEEIFEYISNEEINNILKEYSKY